MATYAIGDIQGCYDELCQLLSALSFDPTTDRLWLVGDLVNRGPQSLAVLRFLSQLGDRVRCVLGNHDLHLLAVARGHQRLKRSDTLQPILEAPDRDRLLQWLQQQPLLYHDPNLGYTMVHAGLPPQWDLATAQQLADEVSEVLQSDGCDPFLAAMYGDQPTRWHDQLRGHDRLRFAVNCFTRLRYLQANGEPEYRNKLGLESAGALLPWFQAPHRQNRELKILFGHWSTLGIYQGNGVIGLDSGCLWGGALSAYELERQRLVSLPCQAYQRPR